MEDSADANSLAETLNLDSSSTEFSEMGGSQQSFTFYLSSVRGCLIRVSFVEDSEPGMGSTIYIDSNPSEVYGEEEGEEGDGQEEEEGEESPIEIPADINQRIVLDDLSKIPMQECLALFPPSLPFFF